jgi:hypothetical protein
LFVRCDQAYPETIHRGHEDCEGACLGVETVDDTVREIAACERGQMPEPEFRTIEPKILYFGTPVALISSLNEDGTTNLAPMSSFWALGWTLMLGLLDETKTAENMERHAECVVNLPAPNMWQEV